MGRKKPKRGVLPKHATSIMRSWLFQHIVVRMLCPFSHVKEITRSDDYNPLVLDLLKVPKANLLYDTIIVSYNPILCA